MFLTKPRIVEALFEQVGALLIPFKDEEFQAIASRVEAFRSMLDAKHMDDLRDGERVAIERDRTRVVSRDERLRLWRPSC